MVVYSVELYYIYSLFLLNISSFCKIITSFYFINFLLSAAVTCKVHLVPVIFATSVPNYRER